MTKRTYKLRTKKISPTEVDEIRELYKQGVTQREIAEKYCTTHQTVSNIVNYLVHRYTAVTDEEKEFIRGLSAHGKSVEWIADYFEIDRADIWKIIFNTGDYRDEHYQPPSRHALTQRDKFTRVERNRVRWLWRKGYSITRIYKHTKLPRANIVKVIRNQPPYDDADYVPSTDRYYSIRNRMSKGKNRLPLETIIAIRKAHESGLSYANIAREYKSSETTIAAIVRGIRGYEYLDELISEYEENHD